MMKYVVTLIVSTMIVAAPTWATKACVDPMESQRVPESNPFLQTWPVDADEIEDAAWLLEGAGFDVVTMAPWEIDMKTGKVETYVFLSRVVDTPPEVKAYGCDHAYEGCYSDAYDRKESCIEDANVDFEACFDACGPDASCRNGCRVDREVAGRQCLVTFEREVMDCVRDHCGDHTP